MDKKNTIKATASNSYWSVLGPALWKILYDGAFKVKYPKWVEIIVFGEHLSLFAIAKDQDTLIRSAEMGLEEMDKWMKGHKMELAPDKTVAIFLKKKD